MNLGDILLISIAGIFIFLGFLGTLDIITEGEVTNVVKALFWALRKIGRGEEKR